eukprot:scaffold64405_cov47-Phaeocystis_antarctica.AAC.1
MEMSPLQVRPIEVGALELRRHEACPLELSTIEVSPLQLRPPEVHTTHNRTLETKLAVGATQPLDVSLLPAAQIKPLHRS